AAGAYATDNLRVIVTERLRCFQSARFCSGKKQLQGGLVTFTQVTQVAFDIFLERRIGRLNTHLQTRLGGCSGIDEQAYADWQPGEKKKPHATNASTLRDG